MDPTRLPLYRYTTQLPQYAFNTIPAQNYFNPAYGWPNTYQANYMSSYPVIPLYTYPNVPLYNQYDPIMMQQRFPQQPLVPPRLPYANAMYGVPPPQTTTQITSTDPALPPNQSEVHQENCVPKHRKLSVKNSSQRCKSKKTDQAEILESILKAGGPTSNLSRSNISKIYAACSAKRAPRYLRKRSNKRTSKRRRSRNTSNNTTYATTELSAIANDGTHGNYKALRVLASDNGDPNDSSFETCDETDDEDENVLSEVEESNWNNETKNKPFHNGSTGQRNVNQLSTTMDYTVIANDKSYSYINYNPKLDKALNKRFTSRHFSRRRRAPKVSKEVTSLQSTLGTQPGDDIFTCDKIISQVLEREASADKLLLEKSRSPELWWDRSTDLGYTAISRNKSPINSLKDESGIGASKTVSSANTSEVKKSQHKSDADENDNFEMAKADDYEVIEFFDFQQNNEQKPSPENDSTMTQLKNDQVKNNSVVFVNQTTEKTLNNSNYNVPNNTPVTIDQTLDNSHVFNKTAPEPRHPFQRKKLQVDWGALQDIFKYLPKNATQGEKKNAPNPSISGQDSAILAHGKAIGSSGKDPKIPGIATNDLFPNIRSKESFNFPPTQFGSSIQSAQAENVSMETNVTSQANECMTELVSPVLDENDNENLEQSRINTNINERNKTYVVMHNSLPATPHKPQRSEGLLRNNKNFKNSVAHGLTKTPKFAKVVERKPSTCSKVAPSKASTKTVLSQSVCFSNAIDHNGDPKPKPKYNKVGKQQRPDNSTKVEKTNSQSIMTPQSKATSKKKFEMIRSLFNVSDSDMKSQKKSGRRSLPANATRNVVENNENCDPDVEKIKKLTRSSSINILETPKKNEDKSNSMRTAFSMLNLNSPTSKNKNLYQQAKPISTPTLKSKKILKHNPFPESKSLPSTPAVILKNSRFHTFEIDISENDETMRTSDRSFDAERSNEKEESMVANRAEIVTIDDVAASFTGNEGDDELSSVSTKASEQNVVNEKQDFLSQVSKKISLLKIAENSTNMKSEEAEKAEDTKNSSKLSDCQFNTSSAEPKGIVKKDCPKKSILKVKQLPDKSVQPTNFGVKNTVTISSDTNSISSSSTGSSSGITIIPNSSASTSLTNTEAPTESSVNSTASMEPDSLDNSCKNGSKTSASNRSLSIEGDSGFSLNNNSNGSLSQLPIAFPMPSFTFWPPGFHSSMQRRMLPSTMINSNSMMFLGQLPSGSKDTRTRIPFQQPVFVQPLSNVSNTSFGKQGNESIKVPAGYEVYPCLAYQPIATKRAVNKFRKTNRTFSVPSARSNHNSSGTALKRHYINLRKQVVNLSHPPLYVFNTSLEHPSVSALKIRERSTKAKSNQKYRKRLEAVKSLTPEDIRNFANVKTIIKSPKLAQLNFTDSTEENYQANRTTGDITPSSVETKKISPKLSITDPINNFDSPFVAPSTNDQVIDCTPTTKTKASLGRKWKKPVGQFLNRLTSSATLKDKSKITRNRSISKKISKRKLKVAPVKPPRKSPGQNMEDKKKAPKDYFEINRALYKTSLLAMASIENRTPVKSKKNLSSSREDVFEDGVSPATGNVADYFGRDLTSSTATIKHKSERRSVGSTPGVRINSETGDLMDQNKAFGTFLCSTTIGDTTTGRITARQDSKNSTGSESSFQKNLPRNLFEKRRSLLDSKNNSTEL